MVGLLLLAGTASWAANGLPRFAVHPLEVGDLSPKDQETLAALWEVLIASVPDIEMASGPRVSEALANAAGKDCQTRDSCLAFLAQSTDSVYGVFGALTVSPKGDELVATARVVRLDGALVRQIPALRLERTGGSSLVESGRIALKRLVDELQLGALPASIPVVASGAGQESGSAKVPGPEVRMPAPMRVAPIAVGGAGVAAMAVGLGFGVAALADRGSLQTDGTNRYVTGEQAVRAAGVDRNASVALVLVAAGGAAVVTGLGLLVLPPGPNPPSAPRVAVAPTRGGAALTLSSEF